MCVECYALDHSPWEAFPIIKNTRQGAFDFYVKLFFPPWRSSLVWGFIFYGVSALFSRGRSYKYIFLLGKAIVLFVSFSLFSYFSLPLRAFCCQPTLSIALIAIINHIFDSLLRYLNDQRFRGCTEKSPMYSERYVCKVCLINALVSDESRPSVFVLAAGCNIKVTYSHIRCKVHVSQQTAAPLSNFHHNMLDWSWPA